MNTPKFVITFSGVISLAFDDRRVAIQTDHPNYPQIREAITNKDWAALPDLVDVKKTVQAKSKGRVEIIDQNTVLYDTIPMHNAMSERLLSLMKDGHPFEYMLAFIDNLMLNPRHASREELYLFLEKNDIPITTDGHFLAYKKVSSNLKSIHVSPDGTYLDHSIGAMVVMDRAAVNENRNETCSTGLHCCSQSYLPSYGVGGGSRIVIVKVNPKDVVAVPSDYKNAKMRVCQYVVVKEHLDGTDKTAFARPVYKADATGMSEAETNEDLVRNAASKITEIVDSFARNAIGSGILLDYRESFKDNHFIEAMLVDLMDEIEEEFALEVNREDVDHITLHTPMRVLINYYETLLLKKGLLGGKAYIAPSVKVATPAPVVEDDDDEDEDDSSDDDDGDDDEGYDDYY